MPTETPAPTPDNPDQQIEYLNQNIENYSEDMNVPVWISFGAVAVGALTGFRALAGSLYYGGMRGGEVLYAAASVTNLFIGSVALGDYRMQHRRVFELKKLKAEALKEPRD